MTSVLSAVGKAAEQTKLDGDLLSADRSCEPLSMKPHMWARFTPWDTPALATWICKGRSSAAI
jgi:hypothetical protein